MWNKDIIKHVRPSACWCYFIDGRTYVSFKKDIHKYKGMKASQQALNSHEQ